jgi:hypothetical protein
MPRNQLILPQTEAIPSRFLSLEKLLIIVSLLSLLHAKVTVFFLACVEKRETTEIANTVTPTLQSCF